tara:strand:- start:657 stop:806 length:150 start_codon:yes stop_codon:yes gene_type:complete
MFSQLLVNLTSLLPFPTWRFSKSLVVAVVECTMEVAVVEEEYYILLAHL